MFPDINYTPSPKRRIVGNSLFPMQALADPAGKPAQNLPLLTPIIKIIPNTPQTRDNGTFSLMNLRNPLVRETGPLVHAKGKPAVQKIANKGKVRIHFGVDVEKC